MSTSRSDPVVRLAHVVGDFGNPFYAEERQRDVWNEASAFGLQLVIWCTVLATTATVWLVGAPAVPWVTGVLLLLGVVCGLTLAYASRLGIELTGRERMARWRMAPYALLVVALAAGLVRAQVTTLDVETLAGMVTGAGSVLLVLAVLLRRRSRDT
jgi:hypothetical protein